MTEEQMSDAQRLNAVNCSGYPFQIAVEQFVESMPHWQGKKWQVLHKEYPWHDNDTNRSGFIDIIINNSNKILVIECKRILDKEWIFLNPITVNNCRNTQVTLTLDNETKNINWIRKNNGLNTRLCMFSVVHKKQESKQKDDNTLNQDKKRFFTIDQIASELVEATDAFAMDKEADYRNYCSQQKFIYYYSVIVTTAKLFTCDFEPSSICKSTGNIPESSQIYPVPYVGYEKKLSTKKYISNKSDEINCSKHAKNHMVYVVNIESFDSFLKEMLYEEYSEFVNYNK